METYGATFKRLRKNKGLTLKQVADELNSISFISMFEHDQTNISVDRFEHLLEKINVSFAEFQIERKGTLLTTVEQKIAAVEKLRSVGYLLSKKQRSPDLKAIDSKLTKLQKQLQQHYDLRLDHYLQIAQWQHRYPDPRESLKSGDYPISISQYLFNVDSWGVYEVRLFMDAMMTLPPMQIRQLVDNLKNKTVRFQKIPGHETDIVYCYLTAISVLVGLSDCPAATHVYHLLENYLTQPNLEMAQKVYLKIIMPFMRGWIKLYENQIDEANQLFAETLNYLRHFQLNHQLENWTAIKDGLISTQRNHQSNFFRFM
ncbi:helix-turn-helix domain-containing protein [Lapidilactobacillus bayanensis]|uniref:helix-turn-helix domain-containing protein n=1 Tax=Lapidilactobacillus bayanensis TaxID=2485998 RepID=UPI001CDD4941|nr:helix-turn-helix transcriptional regulator [Lapidilactobacillus bayanensis]